MTALVQDYETPIADCLRQCAETVCQIGGDCWEFELPGEVPLRVIARQENEWLRLWAPLSLPSASRPSPEILRRMLTCNAGLAAAAKFTLADDPPLPVLAAEILLGEEDGELGARVAGVCDGFHRALQKFAGNQGPEDSLGDILQTKRDEESSGELSFDLATLCKETGWPLAQRAANYVVFELDVAGSFYQAVAQPWGPSGLHLGVELVNASGVDGARRHALNVLLLHASHCLRMARATAREFSGTTAFGWEVWLDRVATAQEVEHALAALSVACRLSASEVSVFEQDGGLARSYLKLRGWCS